MYIMSNRDPQQRICSAFQSGSLFASCVQSNLLHLYRSTMADQTPFLLYDSIPQSAITRVDLLGPDHGIRQAFEFVLRIEGADNTFANLHVESAHSGETLGCLRYSECTMDELQSSGWRVHLELIPTSDVTIKSLCRKIYDNGLAGAIPGDATQGSVDWAMGWWMLVSILELTGIANLCL